LNFKALISFINAVQGKVQLQSVQAINQYLTLHNWAIGCYIMEFEQNGDDRQRYGSKLLQKIADEAAKKNIKGLSQTSLKTCKQVYLLYPQFADFFQAYFPDNAMEQTLIANEKRYKNKISQRPVTNSKSEYQLAAHLLLNAVSFSHIK
jgi:hypothetical protein